MEVSFLGVLHDDVQVLLVHKRLIVLYDIRMFQGTENRDFVICSLDVIFLNLTLGFTFIELELIFFSANVLPSAILRIL